MTFLKKKRRGFSLVEMVAVAIVLAITVISVTYISQAASVLRTQHRNSVYLTTHQLNVMEKLRREMNQLGENAELESYYGAVDPVEHPDIVTKDFSTTSITTEVYVTKSTWDNFNIYYIQIDSRMKGYVQRLKSTYILTDIGIEKDPTIVTT